MFVSNSRRSVIFLKVGQYIVVFNEGTNAEHSQLSLCPSKLPVQMRTELIPASQKDQRHH